MPERWERELRTLRHAEPRADLWPRVEEGPHGSPSPPTSGRKRLLAGGVAFAVFIAAGVFAWNAFRPAPQEGLPPAGAPQAIMAFNEADPRAPSLTITVGGGTHPATLGTHSYSFDGGNGFFDAVMPTFTDADAIPIIRGIPLLIANAPPGVAMSAYEGMTANWGPPEGSPLPLDIAEPGWTFDLPVGRYLMVVDAEWADAQAEFWLPIEVLPVSATPVPAETTTLARSGFDVGYPPGWTPASQSLTPNLADPHELFALGTYPLRWGGSNCAQFPKQAIEDLGPADALIWLAEREQVSAEPPIRPSDLEPWMSATATDDSPDCLATPKDFVHHYGEFTDAGRTFALYVAYGTSASPETVAELWNIANGMRFEPSSGG